MDTGTKIRKATPEDAIAICNLLRRSISELCVADHKNDPEVLKNWLSNKTPENITTWISNPGSNLLVYDDGEILLSVGAIFHTGEITLNYILPEARFKGISKTMVRALEARAISMGHTKSVLTSTVTARRFYLSAGYAENTSGIGKFGIPEYEMSKHLFS